MLESFYKRAKRLLSIIKLIFLNKCLLMQEELKIKFLSNFQAKLMEIVPVFQKLLFLQCFVLSRRQVVFPGEVPISVARGRKLPTKNPPIHIIEAIRSTDYKNYKAS